MSRRRLRQPRRSVDPGSRPGLLLAGAATLALCVVAVLVAFSAERSLPGQSFHTIEAEIADAVTLGSGDEVRIAGDRVGRVGGIRRDGDTSVVDLELEDEALPVPVDSTVHVRPKGLLGSQYVDLVPGKSDRALRDGETIAEPQTTTAVQLADVLDTLEEPEREALGQLLRGLGGGLAGRGEQLHSALAAAPLALRDLSRSLTPLLDREGITARLVREAEVLAAAVEPVRDDLAAGFGDAARALRPFAEEGESVGALLDTAPGALRTVRSSLARTEPTLARATRFARAAEGFTDVAPAGLTALTHVLRDGREPLGDLDDLLDTASDAVGPTLALTAAADPVLPRLRASLEVTREPARILGRYGCDIRGFARNWESFLGYAPVGHTGPLGPLTILRTSTAFPASQLPHLGPNLLAGSGVEGRPAPCRPEGGRGR